MKSNGLEETVVGRSVRSKEKIADALMHLSTSIWAVIFFTVVSIPLAAVIKIILSEGNAAVFFAFDKASGLVYLSIIMVLIGIGGFLAKSFSKKALDIYDSLERYHF